MEQVSRVLFLWRNEVEEQRECVSDMRRRNEALVYNILPPHVAEHFMGNRKRQHDELYSQSYAEVGVLFASMPNFSGRLLFNTCFKYIYTTFLDVLRRFLLRRNGEQSGPRVFALFERSYFGFRRSE